MRRLLLGFLQDEGVISDDIDLQDSGIVVNRFRMSILQPSGKLSCGLVDDYTHNSPLQDMQQVWGATALQNHLDDALLQVASIGEIRELAHMLQRRWKKP